MTADLPAVVHVAAAAIFDRRGRVLIARRPPHVHQGDLWEFPGGKLEPGESVEQALRRELWEELHITPLRSRPLIRVPFQYPDKRVLLDVWRVDEFAGEPHGREGQPVRWVAPGELPGYAFPAANRPIVAAARLPERYLITGSFADDADFLARLRRALNQGIRLVQLRFKERAPARATLVDAMRMARAAGAAVVVNGDLALALDLEADGIHLTSGDLRRLSARPVPPDLWCGASCHDADELAHAVALGVDFAVLSPVCATASHPGAAPLGWERFKALIADLPLPVYALGGLGDADLPQALSCRAQGVAAIGAYWGR